MSGCIAAAMQPLIEQGVYADGKWGVDSDVDLDDPQQCTIQLLLWTMCSQGLVHRVPGDGDEIKAE